MVDNKVFVLSKEAEEILKFLGIDIDKVSIALYERSVYSDNVDALRIHLYDGDIVYNISFIVIDYICYFDDLRILRVKNLRKFLEG